MFVQRNIATKSYCTSIDSHLIRSNSKIDVSINNLRDNKGSKKQPIRVGRGQGSRRPCTAGRGLKGQLSRKSGNTNKGFEGGQTTHWKSVRKYGFTNAAFARTFSLVNLQRLQFWIDTGRLDVNEKITMATLIKSGCAGKLRRSQVGVKILAEGAERFTHKVDLEVSQASSKAISQIKKNGGSVELLHYNQVGIKYLLHPEKFQSPPYLPPAPAKINNKLKKPMEQPSNELYYNKRQNQQQKEANAE
jgi:large subunit ribosomal protein L15